MLTKDMIPQLKMTGVVVVFSSNTQTTWNILVLTTEKSEQPNYVLLKED